MQPLANISTAYFIYMETYHDYVNLYPNRKQNTRVIKNEEGISEVLSCLSASFHKMSKLQLVGQKKVQGILATVVQKASVIKDMVLDFQKCKNLIEDQLKRLRVQISQKQKQNDPLPTFSTFRLQVANDIELSWDDAMVNLIDADSSKFKSSLSCIEIIKCAKLIRETNAVSLDSLLDNEMVSKGYAFKLGAAKNLVEWLPVMLIRRGYKFVVVNLHELYLNGNFFEEVLNVDIDVADTSVNSQQSDNTGDQEESLVNKSGENENVPAYKPGPKIGSGGRPLKHEQFPTLVQKAVDFLKIHGFCAQSRRRNDISFSMGVSIPDLRKYLLRVVPGLSESGYSLSSVRRLLVAPNQKLNSARYYKGLVSAKIPAKCNTATRSTHKDLHFIRSQISIAREVAQSFDSECISFSCDDKNKVNVGTLAVSRYHQISRFFLTDDSPNYLDHDFPYSNCKIIPSGYLYLTKKSDPVVKGRSRSLNRNADRTAQGSVRASSAPAYGRVQDFDSDLYVCDKLGRLHLQYPRSGHLYVMNRSSRFHSSSAESHANDLHFILQNPSLRKNKNSVFLLTDGGPDWSAKSLVTLFYTGRLWRDSNLDYLGVFNHDPGHSCENPIEHKWSPLSKWLVSVTLPVVLEGETLPPWQQSGLSKDEVTEKSAQVFDNAINSLCEYWNKSHDGFPVTPVPIPCQKDPEPYNDHESVSDLFRKGIREVLGSEKLSKLRKEFLFFVKHCTRRLYSVEFLKCTSMECEHCERNPVKSKCLVEFLQSVGCHMPVPKQSYVHDGHYMSFLELKSNILDFGQSPAEIGAVCSSIEVCKRGCKYVPSSTTDKEKHDILVHYNERQSEFQRNRRKRKHPGDDTEDTISFTCNFKLTDGNTCNFQATTYYQLRKHKLATKHLKKRKTQDSTE